MNFPRQLLSSPAHQLLAVCAVVFAGVAVFRWRSAREELPPLPAAPAAAKAGGLPQTLLRTGTIFPARRPAPAPAEPIRTVSKFEENPPRPLFRTSPARALPPASPKVPYGRLIPCETVTALESNRLTTPVIGLVTENVWNDGVLVIPAGAEVHGNAALDRARERLAAEGAWHVVWRTRDARNGVDLTVNGLALDRAGSRGEQDSSAGLRGTVLKTQDEGELRMFAATFLSAATSALQNTRAALGLGGEMAIPAATLRNGVLAGTGAILRDYAAELRDAIARDGFYLRVPAGKPFFLYVTQSVDLPAPTQHSSRDQGASSYAD